MPGHGNTNRDTGYSHDNTTGEAELPVSGRRNAATTPPERPSTFREPHDFGGTVQATGVGDRLRCPASARAV